MSPAQMRRKDAQGCYRGAQLAHSCMALGWDTGRDSQGPVLGVLPRLLAPHALCTWRCPCSPHTMSRVPLKPLSSHHADGSEAQRESPAGDWQLQGATPPPTCDISPRRSAAWRQARQTQLALKFPMSYSGGVCGVNKWRTRETDAALPRLYGCAGVVRMLMCSGGRSWAPPARRCLKESVSIPCTEAHKSTAVATPPHAHTTERCPVPALRYTSRTSEC